MRDEPPKHIQLYQRGHHDLSQHLGITARTVPSQSVRPKVHRVATSHRNKDLPIIINGGITSRTPVIRAGKLAQYFMNHRSYLATLDPAHTYAPGHWARCNRACSTSIPLGAAAPSDWPCSTYARAPIRVRDGVSMLGHPGSRCVSEILIQTFGAGLGIFGRGRRRPGGAAGACTIGLGPCIKAPGGGWHTATSEIKAATRLHKAAAAKLRSRKEKKRWLRRGTLPPPSAGGLLRRRQGEWGRGFEFT
jgi:hypothetical protein